MMDIQRLRNLTTGRLHTDIGHVYEDIEEITWAYGLMTHQLPAVLRAVNPWLRANVRDKRFWDGEHDTEHVGEYDLPEPTDNDREAMLERYRSDILS